jgi:hypothetical protein
MQENAMTTKIDATQVEKLAARGLSADVIADFLGVPHNAFKASMTDNPTVDAAWRRGRANLQMKTMEWLVISAKRGSVQAQIYLADRVLQLSKPAVLEDSDIRYVVEIPAQLPAADWQAAFKPAS